MSLALLSKLSKSWLQPNIDMPVLREAVVVCGDGRRRDVVGVVRRVLSARRPDDGRPVVVRDPLRRRLRCGRRGHSRPVVAPAPRTVLQPRGDAVLVGGPEGSSHQSSLEDFGSFVHSQNRVRAKRLSGEW